MNLFVIGERLNASRSRIEKALRERQSEVIKEEALRQVQAGAKMLNINVGTLMEAEPELMEWTIRVVREAVTVPLSIDTTNPVVIRKSLAILKDEELLINSMSLEEHRWHPVIDILRERRCKFVGLCLDDRGMPTTAERRYRLAREFINRLDAENIARERVFLDPLLLSASVDSKSPLAVLNALEKIKENYPEVKTICGLSNVSYGLPRRRLINQTFVVLLLKSGLDAAILDPLDKPLMANIITAEMLLGRDDFCTKYLQAEMEGFFEKLGQ